MGHIIFIINIRVTKAVESSKFKNSIIAKGGVT